MVFSVLSLAIGRRIVYNETTVTGDRIRKNRRDKTMIARMYCVVAAL